METEFQKQYKSYVQWDDKNIKGFFGEYFYLSNFKLADVYFDGLLYPTSEHAYMAAKTEKFIERYPLVYTSDLYKKHIGLTAAEAREYGQKVTLRPNWDEVKYDYMLAIVFDKFWRNKDLQEKLLSTGDKYLEESCHWHDLYWAKCYCPKHNGEGQNMLGKILMKVREALRK